MELESNLENITLLVCAFNAEEYLEKFELAVLPYLTSMYILVIDDYSVDNTFFILREKFKKYPNVTIIRNLESKGFASALNFGIENVKTDFILRFDIDDYMAPNRAQILLNGLRSGKLDFCGSGYQKIYTNGRCNVKRYPKKHCQIAARFLNGYFGIGGALIIGKTSAFKNLKFDENMIPGEEFDFFLRAIIGGYKLGNVDDILYDYYYYDNSLSNSQQKSPDKVAVYQKSLSNYGLQLSGIRMYVLKNYYYNRSGFLPIFFKIAFVFFMITPRFRVYYYYFRKKYFNVN